MDVNLDEDSKAVAKAIKAMDEAVRNDQAMWELLFQGEQYVLESLASSPLTPPTYLEILSQSSFWGVRKIVAENEAAWVSTLQRLAVDNIREVRIEIARNPKTPSETLQEISRNNDGYLFQLALAGNPNTPSEVLKQLAWECYEPYVKEVARKNPAYPKGDPSCYYLMPRSVAAIFESTPRMGTIALQNAAQENDEGFPQWKRGKFRFWYDGQWKGVCESEDVKWSVELNTSLPPPEKVPSIPETLQIQTESLGLPYLVDRRGRDMIRWDIVMGSSGLILDRDKDQWYTEAWNIDKGWVFEQTLTEKPSPDATETDFEGLSNVKDVVLGAIGTSLLTAVGGRAAGLLTQTGRDAEITDAVEKILES